MHNALTSLMSAVMVLIGLALLVSTVARGGGPISLGVLLGCLFIAAGAGRLYVQRRIGDPGEDD